MSKWKKSSQELIDFFNSLLENDTRLEMRKMFGYPCAFIRGNMCMGLHEENWIIRLSERDREEIKKNFGATQFEPMKGRPMREYVNIPIEILQNQELLSQWIDKSIAFTSTLPLKLPKKRKKTASKVSHDSV